jgi:histidinol dehydrogenase
MKGDWVRNRAAFPRGLRIEIVGSISSAPSRWLHDLNWLPMRRIDLTVDPTAGIHRPPTSGGPEEAVRDILRQVREQGDQALYELTERFDKVRLRALSVSDREVEAAFDSVKPDLLEAMEEASKRIREFAKHQALKPWEADVGGGVIGEVVCPVSRAGCYVPGGKAAYPSTVLMTAIPAHVAGVPEIALCMPPAPDGSLPASTLAAAHMAGVSEIYRVGGAQAIAALAYGTETINKADVIVGPGNIYVALAKQEVAGLVGIDSIAGPSEVAIVTDGNYDPRVVAFDLIAQAEHGPNGTFAVVTWKPQVLDEVETALDTVLDEIEGSESLRTALDRGCTGVLARDLWQAADCINRFAPEHLELLFKGAEKEVRMFRAAGAIFVGFWSPVCAGDYVAGTNHVLPTGGGARWASGLRTSHFQKTSAVLRYDRQALEDVAGHIDTLCAAEGLINHGRAVRARFTGQQVE